MRRSIIYPLTILLLFSCDYNPFKKTLSYLEITPEIVGSWNLLILKGEDSQGHFQYPFDVKVKGYASFDGNNNFSIQYYDATRPRMKYNDPFFSSDPEIRIAFLSGQSMFGKYELFQDSVGIKIAASLNPNFSGILEKRYYKILGDTMLMIAPGRNVNGVYLKEHSIWLRSDK